MSTPQTQRHTGTQTGTNDALVRSVATLTVLSSEQVASLVLSGDQQQLMMDDVCDPSLPSTTSELLVPSCPNKKGKWRKDRGTGKTVITNPYTRAQQEGQRDRESERNKKKENKTKKTVDSCSTLES